jgi:uncharacterized membrane-anchored protein
MTMLRKIKLTSAAATSAARESHLAVKYASLLLCGVTLALSVAPASAEELMSREIWSWARRASIHIPTAVVIVRDRATQITGART